ncbi:MAG TPA: threonylcarbamoyl-AMP synthase [Candidatus Thioglobus sp.]|jgi:tRNA threonylcarbamoyl adenosine modification protein (Sua5/YciO/YrdC/YwlC family)|nr:threonylcarbamoyl-AMP synthase [Candidatus Thioglobus sp.]HIL21283.1 threonylcarbamoyl-AMP synthase [Candidatus Thioglobus sp.]
MSILISIHPENPQDRYVKQVIEALNSGGVIAYPTDSGYALGCTLGNKNGLEQIRRIRELDKHHHFTLMMRDLSHVGEYAKLDNTSFRLMKKILPGAYTFILEGARGVPNRLLHSKRKTIGLRISHHKVVQAILDGLDEPLMSVSLILGDAEFYNAWDVEDSVGNLVEVVIDAGHCPPEPTTVIDLSGERAEVARLGAGSVELLS